MMDKSPFEAIILAGGFGTRLKDVVKDIPKPMAPVNNKPFLAYILDSLVKMRIEKIVLSVGYKSESIREYFKNSYKTAEISYAVEEEALGTGGGIQLAMMQIETENALVLNGDTFFELDINAFYYFHKAKNAAVSIALKEIDDIARYGSVKTDADGRITAFKEKNLDTGKGFINAGAYFIQGAFFTRNNFPQRFSMEKDALEKLSAKEKYYGYKADGYFIDIGIPEDYKRAQNDFKESCV